MRFRTQGRSASERGIEALLVVDLRDEAVDTATGVIDVDESLADDLFGLKRLKEASGLDLEGIAGPAHDEGDLRIGQSLAIGEGGVLHAAIGVMDQAAWRRSSRAAMIALINC